MPTHSQHRHITQLFIAALVYFTNFFSVAHAADINVACASNFQPSLQKIAAAFERTNPHRIRISSGSTGKLYAQIQHGAPFDVFLSADRERPTDLHQQGLAEPPITYAIGRLVLYAPNGDPRARLERDDFRHLAIANPQTAPYGTAARAILQKLQRWDAVQSRLVTGENISQTFQFVHTRNAELGFVALTQVLAINAPQDRYWLIPSEQHVSLEQDAVLLRSSRTPDAARSFLAYLQSTTAREIIARDGYGVP